MMRRTRLNGSLVLLLAVVSLGAAEDAFPVDLTALRDFHHVDFHGVHGGGWGFLVEEICVTAMESVHKEVLDALRHVPAGIGECGSVQVVDTGAMITGKVKTSGIGQ